MNSMNGTDEKRKSDEGKDGVGRMEKENQMFFAKQSQSTRMLLGHSNVAPYVCAHIQVCVYAEACTHDGATRLCVYGFKNCAPPSLLLGRGKQTAVSVRRSREMEK